MKAFVRLAITLAGVAGALGAYAAPTIPAAVVAAVANPYRPDADRQRDENRKPAETIAFSGMKAGETVADFIPGTGYYDRIFSGVVGPKGHVYAFYPAELKNFIKQPLPPDGAAPFAKFANLTALVAPVNQFAAPAPLDIVWLSDNYHDLHDPFFAPADLAQVNAAVFKALKPGGVYLIIDHAAEAGSGLRDTNTLHRIDEAAVKAEVEAAGFKLKGESDALKNPADTRKVAIFDPSIKSKTDQFILKFRKPKA
ncbi:MAG: class I SAM-dependent methyltransferase [Caulobacterales bacterium]